jgi:glutathionylspermidine synthase
MKRIPLSPRLDWREKVSAAGLTFHSPRAMFPQTYWDESAAYQFTAREADTLEAAANQLQEMCLAAAQHVIDKQRYAELAIPTEAIPLIEWAWNQEPPAIYGRFDISWAGEQSGAPPKLLEYNADTPTTLLEAAVIQWTWLEEVAQHLPGMSFLHKADQFNSIHDRLIAKWKDVARYLKQPVYFTALQSNPPDPDTALDLAEDYLTTIYLRDTANQAGIATRSIALQDIGWNQDRQAFVDADPEENQILSLFKLYPWEAMVAEEFGPAALATYRQMTWIEPIWKMLLSNKGILPILWELYPGHELLLEAHFEPPPSTWTPVVTASAQPSSFNGLTSGGLTSYVRKPLHSREGANIQIVRPNASLIATPGPYGDGPFIRQALAPPAVFLNPLDQPRYPILGLWMIDQECGGMGIRESAGPITDNLSSFVPHFFR